MRFRLACLFFHSCLLAYFWVADFYTVNWKGSLPVLAQTLIGGAYIVGLALTLWRLDLLTCRGDSRREASSTIFYLRVIFYYCFVLGLPVVALVTQPSPPHFIKAYGVFMYIVILINFVDFAFPSYRRYLKLNAENKWGVSVPKL